MARLFIFAIGGTGARVMKSLTLLLASGVKSVTSKHYEIVPILIDPHKDNHDLKRAIRLLELYQHIQEPLQDASGFFETKLRTLDRIVATKERVTGNFTYDLSEVSSSRFRDYIGFDTLDAHVDEKPNKTLMDFLFSGKTVNKYGDPIGLLDIDMDIGFVGNPNIGSVVLNQFRDSEEFREFANNFTKDDRVFIISSIFGGTGAAGFPTILKNIRDAHNNNALANKENLEQAKVGAVTVLPYFNVESSETSPIQVSQFIAKTKAALYYYENNVVPRINALYYIGDNPKKPYKNDPGEAGQQNDAHVVELAAAMSIINFMEIADEELLTENGKAVRPICKEFGVRTDIPKLKFLDFGPELQQRLALPLSGMAMFRKYIKDELSKSIDTNPWCHELPAIGSSFLASAFYRNLTEFFKYYDEWLLETGRNERGFEPFSMHLPLDKIINDIVPDSGLLKKNVDYNLLNAMLNKETKQTNYPNEQHKFIRLFYTATTKLLKDRYAHFKMNTQ